MSKAEQAAKDYAKNLGCEEGVWLWKLMADFATSQPFNQQIEQLTQERDFWKIGSFDDKLKAVEKERDELSDKYNDLQLPFSHRVYIPALEQQLSAEKQNNEELSKNFGMFLDRVGDALEDNQSFGYLSIEADEIQQLLNK